MVNNPYFFGLITYPNSKYSIDVAADFLREDHIPFEVFDADESLPTDVSFAICLKYHLDLTLIQLGYAEHLNKSLGVVERTLTLLQNLFLTIVSSSFRDNLRVKISRNRNISANHLNAWRAGSELNCRYVTVLEDDAHTSDYRFTWIAIQRIVQKLSLDNTSSSIPLIIDLSRSFSLTELGLSDFVLNSFVEEHTTNHVYTLVKPATNTLCAVLFNDQAIRELVGFMENRGGELLKSGIPIDWIVNGWLISEPRNSSNIHSIHVKPGLFVQKSLVSFH